MSSQSKKLKLWRKFNAKAEAIGNSSLDDSAVTENDENDEADNNENAINNRANDSNDFVDGESIADSLIREYSLNEFLNDDDIESLGDPIDSDDDQDDDEDNQELRDLRLRNDLASWSSQHNCSRSMVDKLLQILRQYGLNLPKDSRTLKNTPRQVNTVSKCGGQYLYLGLKNTLEQYVPSNNPRDGTSLYLIFNIDGLPLFKSSNLQVWPILCSINNSGTYVICLYCGNKKPDSIHEYLDEFINEYNELKTNGFQSDNKSFPVVLKAITCDAPAKSFIKCTVNHTGYNACERCEIVGVYTDRRITYDSTPNFTLRTDEGFSRNDYSNHQKDISPLLRAGIPCISKIPLDYMHLVCLGVMRRILHFLRKGPPQCRLSNMQITTISEHLIRLRDHIPSEFARRPRTIFELDRWKATELRQFLLYTGPVVLKQVFSKDMFTHFLTFRMAIANLLDEDLDNRNFNLQYSKDLLCYFVENAHTFYGNHFNVYNVHNLIHIADDVVHHQTSLNNLSCFSFENYLKTLKKMVKNSNNPISQIYKKIEERALNSVDQIAKPAKNISNHLRNKYFYLVNGDVVEVMHVHEHLIKCKVLSRHLCQSFFLLPDDSKKYNIYRISRVLLNTRAEVANLQKNQLHRKGICLPLNEDDYVLFPLLHLEE